MIDGLRHPLTRVNEKVKCRQDSLISAHRAPQTAWGPPEAENPPQQRRVERIRCLLIHPSGLCLRKRQGGRETGRLPVTRDP